MGAGRVDAHDDGLGDGRAVVVLLMVLALAMALALALAMALGSALVGDAATAGPARDPFASCQ